VVIWYQFAGGQEVLSLALSTSGYEEACGYAVDHLGLRGWIMEHFEESKQEVKYSRQRPN